MMYLAWFVVVFATILAASEGSKVILLSMDGFRYDYLKKTSNIPNFKKLIENGVTMPYMNNSFVTKTFPCHYTMATGLYAESHGIVSNHMYDPILNKTFGMTNTESFWWDAGEPIWITAVKSNKKAGVFFWPGSETKIQNLTATQWKPYNNSTPFEIRVTTVVDWLAKDNFDLGVLYFNEPDSTGHKFGPDSPEVVIAIERMDDILGQLLSELEKSGIKNQVNLIVTSDHGMTQVDVDNKLIDITEIVSKENETLLVKVVDEGPTANLIPFETKAKQLVDLLNKTPHIHAMLKEDIPERFHYKNNRRIMPVFVYADEGYLITTNGTRTKQNKNYGNHGYDNDLINMKPFFIASGPDFKTGGLSVDPIQSVDIYPLICQLLNIPAAPNNGSLSRAKNLLADKSKNNGNSHFISLCFYLATASSVLMQFI